MVLLGDARVGKTSLVNRYFYDFDKDCPSTISATLYERSIETEIEDEKITFGIWDT